MVLTTKAADFGSENVVFGRERERYREKVDVGFGLVVQEFGIKREDVGIPCEVDGEILREVVYVCVLFFL